MTGLTLFTRMGLAFLLLNLAACSTMQSISIESAMQYSPPSGVDYGRMVEVHMLGGEKAQFRVTEITDEGLGGKPGFFAYEDMKLLKAEQPGQSNGNAWGWIVGALGIAALVALIANADDVRVCSPSPCPAPNR